jgi:hypothetical protein
LCGTFFIKKDEWKLYVKNYNFSIAIIREYAERRKQQLLNENSSFQGLKILEAFSATGKQNAGLIVGTLSTKVSLSSKV